jgi:type IV pilus assembly protein PilW
LSLLEMMIAMGIGLVLVATIGYAYVGARQSFRTQDALSRMQENTRYGFEFMAHDLRMVGSTGGANDGWASILNAALPATVPASFVSLRPALIGYDGSASPAVTPPAVCVTANTAACWRQGDSLTIIYADDEAEYQVTAHDAGARQFTVADATGLSAGDILVASDFIHSAIFQTDSVAGGNVTYAAAGGMSPGNQAISLGTFDTNVNALSLHKLRAVTYYIAPNPATVSSLYRHVLGASAGNAAGTSEEVLAGVDNLTLRYGVDVSNPADKSIDAYWTASQVEAGTDGTLSVPITVTSQADRWQRVLSVQISLAMLSSSAGVSTSGDGRLRSTITNAVALRNRLWDPTQ